MTTRIGKQFLPRHGAARLTLHINGAPYRVRPLGTDDPDVYKAFSVRSPDGAVYHVAQGGHGHRCDCPDHVFHRDGLDPAGCKHIRSMLAVGLLDQV